MIKAMNGHEVTLPTSLFHSIFYWFQVGLYNLQ